MSILRMLTAHPVLLLVIFLTLLFDFINGFHDAANAIATVVSTQVLKPFHAVLWAACFNFLAFFVFGLHVAKTVGTGIVLPEVITVSLILVALISAIFWNILTWYYGIPSSSSHALIGGLVGAAWMAVGVKSLQWWGFLKVIISIVLSPLFGMVMAMIILFALTRLFYHQTAQRMDKRFRGWQLITSALLSLGHGGNDAQKSMGIIAVTLFTEGLLGQTFYVPFWVILSCYSVMALGTLLGGFRIIRTMGMKITKLKPMGGACAELSGATSLFIASYLGVPVSTTHTISGAIVGVGASQRFSMVRWGVAHQMIWAWILTIPATMLFSAGLYWLVSLLR